MSELGNAIKNLRGARTQAALADSCGLSLRTIQRAESGEEIRLSTVRAVSQYLKLSQDTYADLLISWLRVELADDFDLLQVRARKKGKGKALTDADEFMETFRSVPTKYQRELLLAAQRQEVLRSIAPLNELYDRLKNQGS